MADVPCAGCTLCCRGHQFVALMPGDDASVYDTQEVAGMVGLAFKPNGDCVYVTDKGCSIHDRAPVICRVFDCRDDYARMPRAERRKRLAQGILSADVLARGRELHRKQTAQGEA